MRCVCPPPLIASPCVHSQAELRRNSGGPPPAHRQRSEALQTQGGHNGHTHTHTHTHTHKHTHTHTDTHTHTHTRTYTHTHTHTRTHTHSCACCRGIPRTKPTPVN